jgi:hypothetical protein
MSPAEKKRIERNMRLRCILAAALIYIAVFLVMYLVFLLLDSAIVIPAYARLAIFACLMIVSGVVSVRLCYTERITNFIYWR